MLYVREDLPVISSHPFPDLPNAQWVLWHSYIPRITGSIRNNVRDIRPNGKFVESRDQIPTRSTRAYPYLWTTLRNYPHNSIRTNIRDPTQLLPSSIKPSFLIRNISVLVSQLESVCSPDDTNYEFCFQASKAIARKLDSILDSSTAPALSPRTFSCPGTTPGNNTSTSHSEGLDSEYDAIDFSELDNLDFSAWVIDIDFVTGDGVWNAV